MTADTALPLHIRGLTKTFGDAAALVELDVSVPQGQVLALLGASGCGKTTLLRCIAGLMAPDAGEILIQGQVVADRNRCLPPERRKLGMVFQDYALWPHMTIGENLAFPLHMQGLGRSERSRRIQWALELVGLGGMAGRSPDTLSGGQQQRVALARAVVGQPRLLLMDEPLSNLDKSLREQLALEIRTLIDELGLTAVFVTHDQQEAYALADRVAVMQKVALPNWLRRKAFITPRLRRTSPAFWMPAPCWRGSYYTKPYCWAGKRSRFAPSTLTKAQSRFCFPGAA
ncbi:ABC transporter ATP-binding protein [Alkalilimnicola ehrlichii]|uniref:ABC transporter ATP-binding protein n=1 Tax=Alkalilimnicola ehrlichii TaxID=351052 RepID=UPI000E2E71C5|nr:ABC transporter ATP-binding protein [Alkalilimnicola ehrlichii]